MDPELVKQRTAFLKRAKANPGIERKKRPRQDEADDELDRLDKLDKKAKSERVSQMFDYKSTSGTSQYKFSILSKIVRYMKDRHLQGDTHSLNIQEILEETGQTDAGPKIRHWLANEALPNNPKIETEPGQFFKFRPKYQAKDRKSLRRLLEKYDQESLGGILEVDIKESVPNAEKHLKNLNDQIIYVRRPQDKQRVIFYNDKTFEFKVDESLQKLWRSIPLEGTDEKKIDEYLEKQGIHAMTTMGEATINRNHQLSTYIRHVLAPRQNFVKNRYFHTTSYCAEIVPFKLADIGEGIREVTITEWHVKEGDTVAQFDALCDVQSDKATTQISSRYDGIVRKLYCGIDDVVLVGNPLVDIEVEDEESSQSQIDFDDQVISKSSQEPAEVSSVEQFTSGGKILATPAVRRLAVENSLELSEIAGTGKQGRVLKEDVLRYLNNFTAKPKEVASPTPAVPKSVETMKPSTFVPSTPAAPLTADKKEPIKGMKKAMVKSMTNALKIPHFGYKDELELSRLIETRNELKSLASKYDVKLSFMPFFIKAASLALLEYPQMNASVDEKCENILYYSNHNISLALDSPQGLIVPNIKNVQNLSLLQVAVELNRLISLGGEGKLGQDDLSGGTFTLSNIGTIGGTYAFPILMPDQVVIGALGKLRKIPVFDENENVKVGNVMNVSWSADHRVVDGASIARFSNVWKNYLENPESMLLNMK
ncbi:DgyrCDS7849 [Dimorphilus gyrociliatus]|uniref:Dihydrolipoamide acetyltransferase component of pyruvate dehydrogenase complex n=1 Tax=Dimorphilus gyrociliatus TaxID=2664684 RepID=A0A7I8VTD1_9ANNE|nr:DgyrCDS7849 [Dimorphilus gyrociliatus]